MLSSISEALSSRFARKRYSLPSQNHGRGRSHARQPHRIKEAGALGKQEGGFRGVLERLQPIDIPVKFLTAWRRDALTSGNDGKAMSKTTRATQALEKLGVKFTLHAYEYDPYA